MSLELKIIASKMTAEQLEALHEFMDGVSCYISGIEEGTNIKRIITRQGNSPYKENEFGQAYEGVEVIINEQISFDRLYEITKVMFSTLRPGYASEELEKEMKI